MTIIDFHPLQLHQEKTYTTILLASASIDNKNNDGSAVLNHLIIFYNIN